MYHRYMNDLNVDKINCELVEKPTACINSNSIGFTTL